MSTGIVMDFMLKKANGQLELPDLWLNNDIRLIRSRVLRDSKTQDAAVEHADYITFRNVKTVWWILTEYASNFCEEHPMLTKDFPMEMIAELLDMSKTEVVTAIEFLEHTGIIFYDEAEVSPHKWVDCVRTILKPFDVRPYNTDIGSLEYFFEEEAMEYVNGEIMQVNKRVVWETKWNHYYSSALDRYTIAYFCEGKK